MCLAVPMQLVEIDGIIATAELSGVTRKVRIDLVPDSNIGDYILVHAGLAIAKIDAGEAEKTLALLKELDNEV